VESAEDHCFHTAFPLLVPEARKKEKASGNSQLGELYMQYHYFSW